MRKFPGLSFVALLSATLATSAARAQPGEAPAVPSSAPSSDAAATGQPAPQPNPPPPPPGYPAPYPAPYAPWPSPVYAAPVPYGYPPWWRYEQEKKSAGLAFLLEFFLPGAGSVYADHVPGAVITWALAAGGVLLIVRSIHTTRDPITGDKDVDVDRDELTLGVLMALAGRTYGLVDSIVSTGDYNEQLRRRLGLAAALRVGVIPTAEGRHLLAPAVRLTF